MSGNPNKLSQIWQELKRRKVVRVITVYAAAAFVILELVSIIVEPLKLPEWFLPMVIVLLSIGFIIAIILSWIYDIHPDEGIVKTEPARKVKVEDIRKSSSGWKIASFISFLVIVTFIVFNIIPRTNRSDIKGVLEKSIAVLPFKNDSPDQEMYFINGTMEEILDNLCKIGDLRVVGRTSVEQYRDAPKPIPVIAEEMNVNYVLEGSGQRDGNNIRLTVQLLDARNDSHIWSESYYRELENIFELQSEIAQSIAGEIKAIVTPEEQQLIEKKPTTSLTAHDFYQRGREEYHKIEGTLSNRKALERAEDYYNKALVYDSTFALAYTGLAWIYRYKNYWETLLIENFLDTMLILSDIALSFDDQLSEAYVIRGEYFRLNNKKEQAIEEYDKAVAFNPNEWQAYELRGHLYQNGSKVEAIKNFQKAASLHRGPSLPEIYGSLMFSYANAGFKERASHYATEAFQLDEDSASYYDRLAFLEECIGNYEKGIEYAEKAYAIDSTDHWVIHHLGSYHSRLGQFEESLRYFQEYERRFRVLNEPHPLAIHRIGYAYWVNGFKDEAEYYINRGIKFYNEMIELDRMGSFYQLAGIYAFLGEKEKALENLRLSNQGQGMGLLMVSTIKNDRMFDSIRDEPEFQQIVRSMETKYQAEHERVRQWLEENDML